MSARLLTPEEVRATAPHVSAGKTDDELIEIARRIRAVTRVVLEDLAEQRPAVQA